MSSPSPDRIAKAVRSRFRLQKALAQWFEAERRDLPWRRTRDPYAVWISEAMLQQTRVETVIPYYQRFLTRFPDVRGLAAAELDEVMTLWSGLGYYSRARALWDAARMIVERHGGRCPRTHGEWIELPGIGPYTAGAVLSIAFSASEPVVDGNVMRVFARLFALEDSLGSRGLSEDCWALARALVPAEGGSLDPGDWNQALMELGARLCTARTPSCSVCPLRRMCAARAQDRVRELPRPRVRRRSVEVELEIFLVRSRGRSLCLRRPGGGRMPGLFEFPTREPVEPGVEPRLWPSELPLTLDPSSEKPLGELSHSITHHRVRAAVHSARMLGRDLPAQARWVTSEELADIPLTGLTRKVLALAIPATRGRPHGVGP